MHVLDKGHNRISIFSLNCPDVQHENNVRKSKGQKTIIFGQSKHIYINNWKLPLFTNIQNFIHQSAFGRRYVDMPG